MLPVANKPIYTALPTTTVDSIDVAGGITAAAVGDATSDELSYLSGAASNIQAQITAKPLLNNSTLTGDTTFSNLGVSTNIEITNGLNTTKPTTIPGCILWFDAKDPLNNGTQPANGATLSTWVDKSGLNNNATANTPITYNTTGFNGYPALTFTKTQWLLGPVSNVTPTLTLFVMCYMNSLSDGVARVLSLAAPNMVSYNAVPYMSLLRPSGAKGLCSFRAGSYLTNNPPDLNTPYLFETWFDGATNYLTVQQGDTTTIQTKTSSGDFNISSFAIARDTNLSDNNRFHGFIAEIVVYNTALTTTQRQSVEGYLSWKWGLQSNLPSVHPYYAPLAYNLSVSGSINAVSNVTAAKFGAATSTEMGYLSGATSNIQTQLSNLSRDTPTFTGTATINDIQTTVLNNQAMTMYEFTTTGQCPIPVPAYAFYNSTATGTILYLPNPSVDAGVSAASVPNGTIVRLFGIADFTYNGSYTGTGAHLQNPGAAATITRIRSGNAIAFSALYYNGMWLIFNNL